MKLVSKKPIQSESFFWDLSVPDTHTYVLSNGVIVHNCGVGFSVERQEINKLPVIPDELYESDTTIIIRDSKLGWVQGLNELISLLYSGRIPKWDLSHVRPAGSRLKTFGGRASGPGPLDQLMKTIVATFKKASGRKLNSLECHSIATSIAGAVVVGGVRRSIFNVHIELADKSWKHCNEIKIGDVIRTPDNSTAVVTNWFDNGTKEVVKIHLEDGTFFECTLDHRWYVFNHDSNQFELVETRALETGNYSMIYPLS